MIETQFYYFLEVIIINEPTNHMDIDLVECYDTTLTITKLTLLFVSYDKLQQVIGVL